jgi:hypothetical protein
MNRMVSRTRKQEIAYRTSHLDMEMVEIIEDAKKIRQLSQSYEKNNSMPDIRLIKKAMKIKSDLNDLRRSYHKRHLSGRHYKGKK